MSNSDYTLEIISHHPKFNSKSLKKYYVDGIETVGAWGDEPFEIRFKNNTFQKVQVKISVDGTDVLSGKIADTLVSNNMWVVNGYATLSLRSWPETNDGGAAFVFTSANNSVAVHTHGNLSSRGIIAVAVFTEGYVKPIKLTPPTVYNNYYYDTNRRFKGLRWESSTNDISYTSDSIGDCYSSAVVPTAGGLEALVSVGAGEHVNQKITYVSGLIEPVFTETIKVKYVWWDDLVEKLRTHTKSEAQPSGFPGDDRQKHIDLKRTPRIGRKKGSFRRTSKIEQQVFDRF